MKKKMYPHIQQMGELSKKVMATNCDQQKETIQKWQKLKMNHKKGKKKNLRKKIQLKNRITLGK